MRELVSRSTFAYAAVIFAVLFAPQVGRDPSLPPTHLLSVFPDGMTFLFMAGTVFFCVRQALQNRPADEPRFRRGFWFASIACAIGGILDAIAVAGLGPSLFSNRAFAAAVAVLTAPVIWLIGSAMAAVFAFVLSRGAQPAPRSHGGAA